MSSYKRNQNSNQQVVNLDAFSSSLESIFKEYANSVDEALADGLKEGAKVAAQEWRNGAKSAFNGDKYWRSIRRKFVNVKDAPYSVVYSTIPGLPHLLENGHATIGGGRVAGRTHIKPAAESGFDTAYKKAKEEIEKL